MGDGGSHWLVHYQNQGIWGERFIANLHLACGSHGETLPFEPMCDNSPHVSMQALHSGFMHCIITDKVVTFTENTIYYKEAEASGNGRDYCDACWEHEHELGSKSFCRYSVQCSSKIDTSQGGIRKKWFGEWQNKGGWEGN